MTVPTTALVRPGALVHIVLKQDQPTGRTVQGVVQAVLTRGNHPRGIKVRLADGRVGRVQAMATDHETGDATSNAPSTTMPPPTGHLMMPSRTMPTTTPRWTPGPSDIRDEAVPLEQIGLDAFIKPAKQKKKKQASAPTPSEAQTPTSTCPVCNAFQGDADAVAHHVARHFA